MDDTPSREEVPTTGGDVGRRRLHGTRERKGGSLGLVWESKTGGD